MKKIFTTLALITATSAFAATGTLEYQNINGVNGGSNQNAFSLSVKENINKSFAGDVGFTNTQTEGTGKLTTRLETGLTGSTGIGNLSPYVRVALGQKFSNTTDFTYYSVEPGTQYALSSVLTAKVGYRYRNAVDTVNADRTRTARVGLSYAITPKDAIGVRFDRVRGDSEQNVWNINYTRGF